MKLRSLAIVLIAAGVSATAVVAQSTAYGRFRIFRTNHSRLRRLYRLDAATINHSGQCAFQQRQQPADGLKHPAGQN